MGTHYDNEFSEHSERRHHDQTARGEFGPFLRGMGRGAGRGGFGPSAAFGPSFGAGFPGFGPGMGFGPGRGGRGRARKGDVRLAILSLLSEEAANGYGLMKTIAERTDGTWRPSPGSVYPTLQQLVDEGLITAVGEGRQSSFELTETGRAYVADHADEIAKAWSDAEAPTDHRHDEFIGAAMKLAGVMKQFAFDATPEQRKQATAKVDELRRALYSILAD